MKLFIALLFLYGCVPQYDAGECVSEKSSDSAEIYFLHVNSHIKYRYATTVVTSKVVNPANYSQEVFFHMNLPDSAFITSFVMEIGGKEYDAYLREKEEAKKIYDQAVGSGLSAGHVAVSSRDSNSFKISVNIESMAKVKFTLTYEELLQRTLGLYKQVINLNPGQTVRDLKVEVYISESSEVKSLFVPEIKVTNEIETEEKENKHVEITRPNKKQAVIKYSPTVEDQEKAGGKCFEGQFIVQYDVDRKQSCGQALIDEGYFVHFFAPEGLTPLKKLVVFVLDLSGSMYGRKLTQLKQAMSTILDELEVDDFFSIVEFSYSVTVHNLDSPTGSAVISPDSWYHEPGMEINLPTLLDVQQAYPASKDYVNKAKQIITKMSAGGGTNIYDALKTSIKVSQKALEKIKNETRDVIIEPLIVFLTDGEPTVGITNLVSIQSMVKELNVPRTSLFSLGFGNGADMNFLKKLSLGNAGFARTIYEASDAALQLKHFYKQISSPLLTNVTFTYLPGQVDYGTLTKKHFHSLFQGSELVVAGKLANNAVDVQSHVNSISHNGTDKCTLQDIKETDGDKAVTANSEMKVILPPKKKEKEKNELGSLERLWAYLTIKQLLDKREITEDNSHSEKPDEIKENALKLALKYKFVTPLTSLVVVKPNQSEAVSELEDSSKMDVQYPTFSQSSFALAPAAAMPSYLLSGYPRRSYHRPFLSARTGGGPGFASAMSISAMRPVMGPTFVPSTTKVYRRPGAGSGFASAMMPVMAPTFVPPTTTIDRMDVIDQEQETDKSLVSVNESHPLGNYTLIDLEWLNQVLQDDNKTMAIPDGNSTKFYTILNNPINATFHECKTKQSETGKCTHLISCILPQFTSSLQEFLGYFCPIPGQYVGVCCPDNVLNLVETTSIAESTETTTTPAT